jgi:hypothetical protein
MHRQLSSAEIIQIAHIMHYCSGWSSTSCIIVQIGPSTSRKMKKKWKYEDKNCIGCKVREESGEEILTCWFFGREPMVKPVQYGMFYGALSDMLLVANCMMKKMKARQTIIDNG